MDSSLEGLSKRVSLARRRGASWMRPSMLSGWAQCGSSGQVQLNAEGPVDNTQNSKSIMSFRDMKHGALPLWFAASI